ncbi:MAG: bifunctional diguanylate cyclase/phosphodiesterase [Rhizobiales bacterium]|nr:bifunctional diguanylate cyclase/phosphodiesterase [Hyphomicrobiales bacterium]
MSKSRPFVIDFGFKVFLPSLATAVGISLLILHIFDNVFRQTDLIDNAYARRGAQAVVRSLRDGMNHLVDDNARSDEAMLHTQIAFDPGWLVDNWGIDDKQTFYDATFIIDSDGKTVFASTREDPTDLGRQDIRTYAGDAVLSMLASLPGPGGRFAKTAAILDTKGRFMVVGAGVIVPRFDEMKASRARQYRLVFAKVLTPDVLGQLSRQFYLDNLHFAVSRQPSTDSIALANPLGQVVGRLAWTDHSPGTELRIKFSDVVWALVMLFLGVVGALVYIGWRGFKQAHESREEAISASPRDDLTGLPNRRELMNVLIERLSSVRAKAAGLAVVYADLDGFKEVNDAYGHEVGDQLLKSAAAGFAFLAEGMDLVARLGGDEFAIIVSGPEYRERSRRLAANMIEFLVEPMVFGGRVASVSVSVGIVDVETDKIDVEEVLRRADVAMYAAKTAGRNRVHVYDALLDAKRDENRAIAHELRSAIDQHMLGVVYQPIVDARSRRMVGVEALVRWPKESPRHCPPDLFIPVAEEFGLIEDLGRLVLTEACRQAVGWPDIFVSVNVSPIQFMNPNFAEIVERTLHATGLAAGRLEIEVTEGFVIDNASRASAIIDRLHEMRVSVALDDFGTGYSSIGHLRRFHFDKLKLDRSMVVDILHQPSALRLVQGTVAMADALGLRVTAEGIEDENQVSVLRLAGCSLFQGYLFSKPVDARDIQAFLDQDRRAATATG